MLADLHRQRLSVKWIVHCETAYLIENIEGFQPEWFFSTMIYSQDTPFWSETLNMV